MQRAYCEPLDYKSYSDAIDKAMQSNLNTYDTRKVIETMTGSRAAADAAIHLASHNMFSAEDFEPYLRTALVSRIRRIYEQPRLTY